MNAASSDQMAAMLRDALAETEVADEFDIDWEEKMRRKDSAVIQHQLNWWGDRLLFVVGGVAIGGFYVSTFCFEQFEPIGYGPAIVSMAPGIQNATTLFLDQYRQPELEKMSDRRHEKRRFQRAIQVETDNSARI